MATPLSSDAGVSANPAFTPDAALVLESAIPSPGCELENSPRPDSYDGLHIVQQPMYWADTTPLPLIITFHDNYARPVQMRQFLEDEPRRQDYLVVHAGSSDRYWEPSLDGSRIDDLLTQVFADYCVDISRVFAIAFGGGGEYMAKQLCAEENRFKALVQVAGLAACGQWSHPIPSLLIHGSADRTRAAVNDADGTLELGRFRTNNVCTEDATPHDVPACQSEGEDVTPGCVDFTTCETPLRWCQHDESGPNNDNHFWPCFATSATFDFLAEQL